MNLLIRIAERARRWWHIKRGIVCATCHADLRLVATCGMCGRKGRWNPKTGRFVEEAE
jgi:hypothetical protein